MLLWQRTLTRAIQQEAKGISKSRAMTQENGAGTRKSISKRDGKHVVGRDRFRSYRVVESSKNLRMRNLRIQGLVGMICSATA